MNSNLPILDAEFFRGSDAIACEALTQHQLRAGPYRRLFHGIYVAPGVDITHELKCRAIALCSPLATITGRSAATVHGVQLARAGDEVELVVPKDRPVHRTRGISMRSVCVHPGESIPWRDVALATPLRAAFDMVTSLPIPQAVGGVDALVRAGVVDQYELTALVHQRHDDGVLRGRKAMELIDPRAESPKESELRVLLSFAGLEFEPQVEIDLSPSWRVRADLARREERVIVEYDGAWHGDELQVVADRRRRQALRDVGWTVFVFTDHDLRGDYRVLADQIDQALSHARRQCAS